MCLFGYLCLSVCIYLNTHTHARAHAHTHTHTHISIAIDHMTHPLLRFGSCLVLLLGGSGGVVNSLDFCPASLKSLGCLYFTMESGDSEFTNFTLPTLKNVLEARSQNVSGNKQ